MADFLTLKETAKKLGVHTATVSRYCDQGRITFYQVGERKKFKLEDIDNYIQGVKCDATDTSENPFDAS